MDARSTEARRMRGIALDLGRTAGVRFDEQALRRADEARRARIEVRDAWERALGLVRVRHDRLARPGAGVGSERRGRGAELEEIAARQLYRWHVEQSVRRRVDCRW